MHNNYCQATYIVAWHVCANPLQLHYQGLMESDKWQPIQQTLPALTWKKTSPTQSSSNSAHTQLQTPAINLQC